MSLSLKDKELIDKYAKKIVDKGLGTIAILAIDSVKPLSYIGSQVLYMFNPLLTMFPYFSDFDRVAELIEDKENVEYFLTRIEYFMEEEEKLSSKKISENKKKLLNDNNGAKNE